MDEAKRIIEGIRKEHLWVAKGRSGSTR